MDADFWLQRWQQNQIGFHQADVNPYLMQYWAQLGLNADARVFVPLCGKSLDMRWLTQQGHEVVGVELSQQAVEAYFHENALAMHIENRGPLPCYVGEQLALFCGDLFQLTTTDAGPIDAFYDRASLVALPPDRRLAYMQHLTTLLTPGTPGLLVTMEYPQHEMQGPPFSIEESALAQLCHGRFDYTRIASHDVLVHNPHFRDRGLSRLMEHVYRLTRVS